MRRINPILFASLVAVFAFAVPSALAGGGNDHGDKGDKQHQSGHDGKGDKDQGHHGKGDDGDGHHGHKPPKPNPEPEPTPGPTTPVVVIPTTPGSAYVCPPAGDITSLPQVMGGTSLADALSAGWKYATFVNGDLSGPQLTQPSQGVVAGSLKCGIAPGTCPAGTTVAIGHDGLQMVADTQGAPYDQILYGTKGEIAQTIGALVCTVKPINVDPPGWKP